jgi:hypothetical protein
MANRAQRICIVAAAVLCIAVGIVFFGGSWQRSQSRHRVEAELQINSDRFVLFIESQISSITKKQPDGKIAIYDVISPKPGIQKLTLTAEKKLTIPDDHGFTELALVSVANNQAMIAYLTMTDLGSFGEDTTSVHSGVVTIDVQIANPK